MLPFFACLMDVFSSFPCVDAHHVIFEHVLCACALHVYFSLCFTCTQKDGGSLIFFAQVECICLPTGPRFAVKYHARKPSKAGCAGRQNP